MAFLEWSSDKIRTILGCGAGVPMLPGRLMPEALSIAQMPMIHREGFFILFINFLGGGVTDYPVRGRAPLILIKQ
jgi:hypothetical protein